MTLRDRIKEHLDRNNGDFFSNAALAMVMQAPEPSVRRATRELVDRNLALPGMSGTGRYVVYGSLPLTFETDSIHASN